MKIYKTILAVIGIMFLVVLALFLPTFINDLTDKKDVSKIKFPESDSVYEVNTNVNKSTVEKLKTLRDILAKKREAQVVQVPFIVSENKQQEIEQNIQKEFVKWFGKLQKIIQFEGIDLSANGYFVYKNIELYTIYDTNISYYVCDLILGVKKTGQKYNIKLYVDGDDYKIYLAEWNSERIVSWLDNYWNSQYDKSSDFEWVYVAQDKLKQYLAKYYGIDNVEQLKENQYGEYGVNLNDLVQWNILRDVYYYSGMPLIQLGIDVFDAFTYGGDSFVNVGFVDNH